MTEKTCAVCGKVFLATGKYSSCRVTCSDECRKERNRLSIAACKRRRRADPIIAARISKQKRAYYQKKLLDPGFRARQAEYMRGKRTDQITGPRYKESKKRSDHKRNTKPEVKRRKRELEQKRREKPEVKKKASEDMKRWSRSESGLASRTQARHRRRQRLASSTSAKRLPLSEAITVKRLIVRDKGKCQLCGCRVTIRRNQNEYPDNLATIDHIIPIAKGGVHDWSNVQLACWKCNVCVKRSKKAGQKAGPP